MPLVIVVYMLVCVGCILHYWTARGREFNPLLHFVLPIGGIVLFFFPLYYQFSRCRRPTRSSTPTGSRSSGRPSASSDRPRRGARPERLRDVDRVYVEDETVPELVA